LKYVLLISSICGQPSTSPTLCPVAAIRAISCEITA